MCFFIYQGFPFQHYSKKLKKQLTKGFFRAIIIKRECVLG